LTTADQLLSDSRQRRLARTSGDAGRQMSADADAELANLRRMLRDLVALSAIPAAWVGREPAAVAAGLADALTGLLQLDFAYVRLCVPDVAGAVEVTRGHAWDAFPRWLENYLAEGGRL
jgi:hypothetical protein